MAETDEKASTCPACGKPVDGEPCCEYARQKNVEPIEVIAEVISDEGDRRPIGTRWLRIGRDEGNDIVLTKDTFVSRFHAWITFEQESFWLEDLGSTNGTLLNGARVKRRELLSHGDQIKIGESELTFALLEKSG